MAEDKSGKKMIAVNREVRRQLDEETQGMTIPQFLAYVHRGAVECQRLMDERKAVCEKETAKDGN